LQTAVAHLHRIETIITADRVIPATLQESGPVCKRGQNGWHLFKLLLSGNADMANGLGKAMNLVAIELPLLTDKLISAAPGMPHLADIQRPQNAVFKLHKDDNQIFQTVAMDTA